MSLVKLMLPAPDFTLQDVNGKPITLSDFKGRSHVILVLNRGFT